MAESTAPILDLATIANRPTVAVDGAAYPMRAEVDFTIFQYSQHRREIPRFSELMNLDREMTDAEGKELQQLLDRLCRRVLDAPPAVHEKLTDGLRVQIVNEFFHNPDLKTARPGVVAAEIPAPAMGIGASSAPPSSDSTAATH